MIYYLKLMIFHTLLASLVMLTGLCTSYYLEKEHPQIAMGYIGLYFRYCFFGVPLILIVALLAELTWNRKGWLFASVIAAVIASYCFLQTDRFPYGSRYYFMSDRNRPPVLIGRTLEFLNPSPNIMQSNVATYYPLLAIMTFFLPIATTPCLRLWIRPKDQIARPFRPPSER